MLKNIFSVAVGSHNLQFCRLTTAHIAHMLTLQDNVISGLKAKNQSAFMLEKSPEKYFELVNETNTNFGVGIFTCDHTLIGQAWMSTLTDLKNPVGLLAVPSLQAHLNLDSKHGLKIASIHNVMVSPDNTWRKHGLMPHMLNALNLQASAYGIHKIYAEIAEGNAPSYNGFVHHGYTEVAQGIDESDGTKLVYVCQQRMKPCLQSKHTL